MEIKIYVPKLDVELGMDDISSESYVLTESICSDQNLRFGACESAQVSFDIIDSPHIPNLTDLELEITYMDDDDTEFKKVGTFRVSTDRSSGESQTRQIVALNAMALLSDIDVSEWFEELLPEATSQVTVFDMRNSLFEWLAANTDFVCVQSENSAELPNDDFVYTRGDLDLIRCLRAMC